METTTKLFSRYQMVYAKETKEIKKVTDANGVDTMFTYSFYSNNQEYLDSFTNILDFVKPKREQTKTNNIVVDLELLNVRYSSKKADIEPEHLQLALGLIKNALIETDPRAKELRNELRTFRSRLDTYKEMQMSMPERDLSEGIADLERQVAEVEARLAEVIKGLGRV